MAYGAVNQVKTQVSTPTGAWKSGVPNGMIPVGMMAQQRGGMVMPGARIGGGAAGGAGQDYLKELADIQLDQTTAQVQASQAQADRYNEMLLNPGDAPVGGGTYAEMRRRKMGRKGLGAPMASNALANANIGVLSNARRQNAMSKLAAASGTTANPAFVNQVNKAMNQPKPSLVKP